ncbi:MAG: hypothetical protein QNK64_00180 [Saprospiraceae bacterium]
MKTLSLTITVSCLLFILSCKNKTTTTITVDSSATESSTTKKAGEIDHYICFREDGIKDLEMSVSFDIYDNALKVKYKGQSSSTMLHYVDEVIITPGEPATKTVYIEMLDGQENGSYEFTHSGNWNYAKYIRKSDGEEFNFSIDHDQTATDSGYRITPCY